MAPKYRQFRLHRAHEISCKGIIGKTVSGSVATYATTQQLVDEIVGSIKIDAGHGLALALYSAERCLVDLIRLRHREGADVAWDALRRRTSKPAGLLKMATHFHGAERAVRLGLEIVL